MMIAHIWSCPCASKEGNGRVEEELHLFWNSAVDVGEWATSRPGRIIPRGKRLQYVLSKSLGGELGQVWTL
jgi:hypothetical protein